MLEMIVIFAHWCPICNMMLPVAEEIEADYAGKLTVTWIDAEEHPEALESYEIQIVPTFILQCEGREIARMAGMIGEQVLKERINASIFL